ncbi:carbon-nitrogen hydrolase family protein [Halobacteriaceae archaeon GCM10025711]
MVAESFTLAAAQVEPVYHDKEATLDKTCRWIQHAGEAGADLVVFPETYFPGYPYWRGSVSIPRWTDLMVDLQKNSLHVDDDAVAVLGDAVREADVNVVLGTNEVSDRPGSETLYNSLFFFDRSGDLLGRHRKLMPTHEERAIWGRGDPASLRTYDTDLGTLGGLVCYENHMTLSKAALAAMGEEVHAAVWPGFWEQHGHPGDKTRAEDADATATCDIYPAVREYAFETQSFVASTSAYMSDDVPEAFGAEELGFNVAAGGSMLVNPAGIVKAGPAVGEETLLTAAFSRDERRATKAYFDAMGHYARWDAVSLSVSDAAPEPMRWRREDVWRDGALSPAAAEAIAEEHEVPIEAVEDVAAEIRSE